MVTHVILGLPGETTEQILETVDYVAHSGISGVKLQLLHVLSDTDLADYYAAHPFSAFFDGRIFVYFIVTCLEHLPPSMVVHRITGDGPRKLLVAPLWSTDKKRVLNTIHKRLRERDTYQGADLRRKMEASCGRFTYHVSCDDSVYVKSGGISTDQHTDHELYSGKRIYELFYGSGDSV